MTDQDKEIEEGLFLQMEKLQKEIDAVGTELLEIGERHKKGDLKIVEVEQLMTPLIDKRCALIDRHTEVYKHIKLLTGYKSPLDD